MEGIKTTAVEQEQTERTFTQEDVNRIINKKYSEWASKTADYEDLKAKAQKFDEMEEANKTELQKATEKANQLQAQLDEIKKANDIRAIRDKVALELEVPAHLLTGSTAEECETQAKAILDFAKPNAYPSVKDGGEVSKAQKKDAVTAFEEWFLASTN